MTSQKSERGSLTANGHFIGGFTEPPRITRGVIGIVALVAIFYAFVEGAYSLGAILSITTGSLLFLMALRPAEAWHGQRRFGDSSLLDFAAQFLMLIIAALIFFKASFAPWINLIATITLFATGAQISRYIRQHRLRLDAWMDGTGY